MNNARGDDRLCQRRPKEKQAHVSTIRRQSHHNDDRIPHQLVSNSTITIRLKENCLFAYPIVAPRLLLLLLQERKKGTAFGHEVGAAGCQSAREQKHSRWDSNPQSPD